MVVVISSYKRIRLYKYSQTSCRVTAKRGKTKDHLELVVDRAINTIARSVIILQLIYIPCAFPRDCR